MVRILNFVLLHTLGATIVIVIVKLTYSSHTLMPTFSVRFKSGGGLSLQQQKNSPPNPSDSVAILPAAE